MRRYERGSKGIVAYRFSKSAVLFLSWICLGLFNEIVGPTLGDLMARVGANYEEIGRVLSSRSAGMFIGSLVGGFLHDRFPYRRDMFLVVAMLLQGATSLLIPWSPLLWLLGIIFHVQGYGHGLLTTGGNPTLIYLWAEKAPGPLNFMHSGFGIGASLAPLIAHPFLSDSDHLNGGNTSSVNVLPLNDSSTDNGPVASNAYQTINSTHTEQEEPGLSQIEFPYMIIGVSCFVVAVMFLVYACRRIPKIFQVKENTNTKAIINPGSCAGGSRIFGVQMFVFIFLYYMLVVGGERAYGKFVFSFARKSTLQFSKERAVLLNSLYWLSFMLGRILCTFIAQWIPVHVLLFAEVAGTLLSAIGLNIWNDTPLAFWIFTFTFGFFKSPLFPTGLGWANRYIQVTSMAIMIVNIGSACGGMLVQWLTGYMFEYHGPITFVYIILTYSILLTLLVFIMHFAAHRHGDRFKEGEDGEEQVEKAEEENLSGDQNKKAVELSNVADVGEDGSSALKSDSALL